MKSHHKGRTPAATWTACTAYAALYVAYIVHALSGG